MIETRGLSQTAIILTPYSYSFGSLDILCAVRDSWRSEFGESATVAHEGLLPKDICADRDGRWTLRRFFNFIRMAHASGNKFW
jgi:hypothetical protein